MTRVAVLGLGAMGSRIAARIRTAGHDLVVWSRSGARGLSAAAPTPRAAASEADIVISMVTDDRASREVWLDDHTGAVLGLRPGTIAIEASTITPVHASVLRDAVALRGADFVDAPVVGSRPQADAGTLVVLAGGSAEVIERARSVVAAYASTVHHVGATPAGAATKLLANVVFAAQVAVVAELIGAARDVDVHRAFEVLGTLPATSAAARVAATTMLAGQHDPMFTLDLVDKDIRYAIEAAAPAPLPMTARLHDVLTLARSHGLGAKNLTALVELYRR